MRQPFTVRERPGESPFWWFDFRLAGRRYRGPTSVEAGAHNKRAAEREAAALWLAECERQGVEVAAASGEFDTATLIDDYLDGPIAARAPSMNPRYSEQLETDLLRAAARFPSVEQITRDSWNRAQEDWRTSVKPIGPRSCQRITAALRPFLRWCERRKAIVLAPRLETASDEDVAAVAKDRRAFTKKERDDFLRELRKIDLRAWHIYTVLLYTALRKSGLERTVPRWIDWRRGWLTMPPAAQKRGKKPRRFKLHPRALASLRALLPQDADPGKPIVGAFDYDDHNTAARAGIFWRAVKAAQIDLHGLTAHHVTRHTAATIAGNEGASLREIMALGGWTTPAMAMRYVHDDDDVAERVIGRL